MDERKNYLRQVTGPPYLGPRTFLRAPLLTEPEELAAARPDIVIVGAPWDDSVVSRPGGRFGPQAIRTANYIPPYWHPELEVAPLEELSIADYGDAVCSPGLVEESHSAIEARVEEIVSAGAIPIILGGDHSVTRPAATAVAKVLAPGRIGILHFDAHADTAESVFGNLLSHGTPMRRLIESGSIPGHRFIQMGVRGYSVEPSDLEWMRQQGMTTFFMSEIRRRGLEGVLQEGIERLRESCDGVYISIDIDVLDPGFAPGTGTPEPGGLSPYELLFALREAALSLPVVAMDVVEVIPAYDHADITAHNANQSILEVISAIAKRRQTQVDGVERTRGNEEGNNAVESNGGSR